MSKKVDSYESLLKNYHCSNIEFFPDDLVLRDSLIGSLKDRGLRDLFTRIFERRKTKLSRDFSYEDYQRYLSVSKDDLDLVTNFCRVEIRKLWNDYKSQSNWAWTATLYICATYKIKKIYSSLEDAKFQRWELEENETREKEEILETGRFFSSKDDASLPFNEVTVFKCLAKRSPLHLIRLKSSKLFQDAKQMFDGDGLKYNNYRSLGWYREKIEEEYRTWKDRLSDSEARQKEAWIFKSSAERSVNFCRKNFDEIKNSYDWFNDRFSPKNLTPLLERFEEFMNCPLEELYHSKIDRVLRVAQIAEYARSGIEYESIIILEELEKLRIEVEVERFMTKVRREINRAFP